MYTTKELELCFQALCIHSASLLDRFTSLEKSHSSVEQQLTRIKGERKQLKAYALQMKETVERLETEVSVAVHEKDIIQREFRDNREKLKLSMDALQQQREMNARLSVAGRHGGVRGSFTSTHSSLDTATNVPSNQQEFVWIDDNSTHSISSDNDRHKNPGNNRGALLIREESSANDNNIDDINNSTSILPSKSNVIVDRLIDGFFNMLDDPPVPTNSPIVPTRNITNQTNNLNNGTQSKTMIDKDDIEETSRTARSAVSVTSNHNDYEEEVDNGEDNENEESMTNVMLNTFLSTEEKQYFSSMKTSLFEMMPSWDTVLGIDDEDTELQGQELKEFK